MIPNNMRRAQAAASAGPTLTAVNWPAGFSNAYGMSIETWPPLQIAGATTPQTLRLSVGLPSVNDSVDIYSISTNNNGVEDLYGLESFNTANGQLTTSPCSLWIACDYTGSETLPRTVTLTITHLEQSAVVGSFTFTFNPEPV